MFSWKFSEILQNAFLMEHFWWLLLQAGTIITH